jgi:hypothetical protein
MGKKGMSWKWLLRRTGGSSSFTYFTHHYTFDFDFLLLSLLYRQDFIEVMDMIDKRLNDKGKNWKHVFKVSRIVQISNRMTGTQHKTYSLLWKYEGRA